jgi:FAD/FMN-containing dehydrogenase
MDEQAVLDGDARVSAAAILRLRESLQGDVLVPGDETYDGARRIFNRMVDRRPALIARCAGPDDVVAAVGFARENDLLVSVRGGGHNVSGVSVCDGGLMIDLSEMNHVSVEPAARTAHVAGGCTWAEVNNELQRFELAAAGGFVGTTGVGGLTLGGGLGWLVRKHGLACDNLISVEVVTADGDLVTASATENADLFWALRGGGGNFGIATAFEFRVHPIGMALAGLVIHPFDRAREVLRFWRDFTAAAPEDFNSSAILLTAPTAPFVPEQARGLPAVALGGVCIASLDAAEAAVRPIREFGAPVVDMFQPMPYSAAQVMADDIWPPGHLNYWKSNFIRDFTDEALEEIIGYFANVPSPLTSVVLEHNGDGALARMPEDATAFGHRCWRYNILITSMWDDSARTDENVEWTRALWRALGPVASGDVYVNYLGAEGEARVRAAYGPAKYERLVQLKKKYDPSNFLRLNQNIAPWAR